LKKTLLLLVFWLDSNKKKSAFGKTNEKETKIELRKRSDSYKLLTGKCPLVFPRITNTAVRQTIDNKGSTSFIITI